MKPTTGRVLKALERAGTRGCTTGQLCVPEVGGVRFGARIAELRHEHGYEVAEQRVTDGSSLYHLVRGVEQVDLPRSGVPYELFRDYTVPDGAWIERPLLSRLKAAA